MAFVTFTLADYNEALDLDGAGEDDEEEDDAQQALPDPEFHTDADGKPIGVLDEEPARGRLLSHAKKKGTRKGGKK